MVTVATIMHGKRSNHSNRNSPLGSDARINIVIEDSKTIKNIPKEVVG